MLIFHRSLNSCTEIIEKKLLNYPVSGFVCRNCREYVSWVAPKKALVARYHGFRKIPCSKIPELVRLLKPPIYCKDCSKRLGMP
jgi:uncharacterized protein YlaI